MDPDAALARLRELLAVTNVDRILSLPDGDHEAGDVLDEVCDLFDGLDSWMSKKGALPKAWQR